MTFQRDVGAGLFYLHPWESIPFADRARRGRRLLRVAAPDRWRGSTRCSASGISRPSVKRFRRWSGALLIVDRVVSDVSNC
jgi:hypothetical protein